MIKLAESLRSIWRRRFSSIDDTRRVDSFTTDLPIVSAADDKLDRSSFARALGSVLYRHRGIDSLVVALRGDWGSGKTSIKNLVIETLSPAGEPPMKVATFNPWRWGDDTAITRAFFREIAVALGDAEQSLPTRRSPIQH